MIIVHYDEHLKTKLKDEITKKHLEKLFLWTFGWAIGSTLASESYDAFEKIMTETFPPESLPRGSTFDYVVRITRIEGKVDVDYDIWEDQIPDFLYVRDMSYFDMVV